MEKSQSIVAVKSPTMSEEYLKDHFPRFPLMPGVIMLEALFQASMFLVRVSNDFQHSMVVLREAKGLKFAGFVQPGDQLRITADIISVKESITNLKVSGQVNDDIHVSGRMVLDSFNLSERDGVDAAHDRHMKQEFRLTFKRLCNQLEQSEMAALANSTVG